jgi:hypothetical protein
MAVFMFYMGVFAIFFTIAGIVADTIEKLTRRF